MSYGTDPTPEILPMPCIVIVEPVTGALNVPITVQAALGIVKLVGVVVPVRPQVPLQPAKVLPPLGVAAMLTVAPPV